MDAVWEWIEWRPQHVLFINKTHYHLLNSSDVVAFHAVLATYVSLGLHDRVKFNLALLNHKNGWVASPAQVHRALECLLQQVHFWTRTFFLWSYFCEKRSTLAWWMSVLDMKESAPTEKQTLPMCSWLRSTTSTKKLSGQWLVRQKCSALCYLHENSFRCHSSWLSLVVNCLCLLTAGCKKFTCISSEPDESKMILMLQLQPKHWSLHSPPWWRWHVLHLHIHGGDPELCISGFLWHQH